MPPAKRSTSRSTSRRTSTRRKSSQSGITNASRAQLEKTVKRLEKSLDDARDALASLGKDASHGGQRTYRDLGNALKSVRSDAQKANRSLTKEIEKLRAAVTPGGSSSGRSTSRSSSSRSGARKTSTRSSTARKASSTARKASGTARKTSSAAKSTARSGARKATGRATGSRSRRSS